MSQIFSRGKLLLTSEYVVLDGAEALAVPTNWGQEFFFGEQQESDHQIIWTGKHQGQIWLTAKIDYKSWQVLETNNPEAAEFVLKTLKNCQLLGSTKFDGNHNLEITSDLQFPSNYGLGSSSTLMASLAKWAGVDAFALNEKSLGGSGYDVAVAQANHSILFKIENNLPSYREVDFQPNFLEDLVFVHLNKKQDSRDGIRLYRSKEKSVHLVAKFNHITHQVLEARLLSEFSDLMLEHENLLSEFLGLETTKKRFFEDCPSFIKSLGAWGGDFVLTSQFEDYEKYFSKKGFETIIPWKTMVYS
ncbi:GYDIA family GHMP kinase [Soonwooa sp.]|uniref:GYDIA family GHMP kinase n=1 Tax=Soonwooa sp. TaxID=1938592 RepID=UPI002617259B|nr:GYDIA family GHMP kinase [Soonwooa sp.]